MTQQQMSERTNIVLIGMPGSGKSTVGVILAKEAAMGFVDTDLLIQTDQGRSLQAILDSDGHMALRRIEASILCSLNLRHRVIATGGSAVYSQAAMAHLKQSGVAVFLDVDLATIRKRVDNFDTRGIAKRPDQSMEELFQERHALYTRHADITVDGRDLPQEVACRTILKSLRLQKAISFPAACGGRF